MKTWFVLLATLIVVGQAHAQLSFCPTGNIGRTISLSDGSITVRSSTALGGNSGLAAMYAQGKQVLYSGSLWVGGMVNGELRTSASTAPDPELSPGWADGPPGMVEAGCASADHVWLATDAGGNAAVYARANDVRVAHPASGSDPLGIEVELIVVPLANNSSVLRYRVTNTTESDIEDAYAGLFADFDLGNFDDDYVGSDSSRALVYVYNADNFDQGADGFGSAPPAAGISLLQGPLVPADGDTAYVADAMVLDMRNQSASGAGYFSNFSQNNGPSTAEEYYAMLRGLRPDGLPWRSTGDGYGSTGGESRWAFHDPPMSGWDELSVSTPPGDRRVVLGVGPFAIEAGATQDVAFIMSFARGVDNVTSATDLIAAAPMAAGSGPVPYGLIEENMVTATVSTTSFNVPRGHDVTVPVNLENAGGGDGFWGTLTTAVTFKSFEVTSNAAGPLNPTEPGAFGAGTGFPTPGGLDPDGSRQQSTTNAAWGIHALGAAAGFDSFFSRVTRGGFIGLEPAKLEIRFTAAGGMAFRRFDGGDQMPVPFELWRTLSGGAPVRLIPAVCEATCSAGTTGGVFDIGGSHAVFSSDAPESDAIYWHLPTDLSAGDVGYRAWESGSGAVSSEILARMTLVQKNGGAGPPYAVELPEVGTTFAMGIDAGLLPFESGTVAAGGSASVQLELNTSGLPYGDHNVDIMLFGHGQDDPIVVPVAVSIVGPDTTFDISTGVDPLSVVDLVGDTLVVVTPVDPGLASSVRIQTFPNTASATLSSSVKRRFVLEPDADGLVVDGAFYYDQQEFDEGGVGGPESTLQLFRLDPDNRWRARDGVVDTVRNVITVAGLDEYGEFAIASSADHALNTNVEQGTLSALSVFPNPASNLVRATWSQESAGVVEFVMVDVLGRVVARQTINVSRGTSTFDHSVGDLSAGVYFVTFRSSGTSTTRQVAVVR